MLRHFICYWIQVWWDQNLNISHCHCSTHWYTGYSRSHTPFRFLLEYTWISTLLITSTTVAQIVHPMHWHMTQLSFTLLRVSVLILWHSGVYRWFQRCDKITPECQRINTETLKRGKDSFIKRIDACVNAGVNNLSICCDCDQRNWYSCVLL